MEIFKVLCINNKHYEDSLTVGKWYEINFSTYNGVRYIINDRGGLNSYLYNRGDEFFITINEYREKQLEKLEL